jgi:hypothetical protein
MYTGWQHSYSVFCSFLYIAVLGLYRTHRVVVKYAPKPVPLLLSGLLGVYLVSLGFWIVRNHPYQYVYFNYPARQHAEENFELDRVGIALYDIYNELLRIDSRERITISGGVAAINLLMPEERARIVAVQDMRFAPDYRLVHSRGHIDHRRFFPGYQKIYNITVDGFEVAALHKYIIETGHFDPMAHLAVSTVSSSNPENANSVIDGNTDSG